MSMSTTRLWNDSMGIEVTLTQVWSRSVVNSAHCEPTQISTESVPRSPAGAPCSSISTAKGTWHRQFGRSKNSRSWVLLKSV